MHRFQSTLPFHLILSRSSSSSFLACRFLSMPSLPPLLLSCSSMGLHDQTINFYIFRTHKDYLATTRALGAERTARRKDRGTSRPRLARPLASASPATSTSPRPNPVGLILHSATLSPSNVVALLGPSTRPRRRWPTGASLARTPWDLKRTRLGRESEILSQTTHFPPGSWPSDRVHAEEVRRGPESAAAIRAARARSASVVLVRSCRWFDISATN